MLFSALVMMVIWILFWLTFSSLIGVSSVLSQILNPSYLFLMFSHLFLLSHILLLFHFFLLPCFLFFFLSSISRRIDAVLGVTSADVENMTLLGMNFVFLFIDFFIKSFSILFDWIFSILVDRYLNNSFVLDFFFTIVKIFEKRMSESIFNCDSMLRIED